MNENDVKTNEDLEVEEANEAFEAELAEKEPEMEPDRVSTMEHLKGIKSNLKEDAGKVWNSKPIKAVRKGTKIVIRGAAIATAIGVGVSVGKAILNKDADNPLLDNPDDGLDEEPIDGEFEVMEEDNDSIAEELKTEIDSIEFDKKEEI